MGLRKRHKEDIVGTWELKARRPKISIVFEVDVFNAIEKLAKDRGVSFSSITNEMCYRRLKKFGLMGEQNDQN